MKILDAGKNYAFETCTVRESFSIYCAEVTIISSQAPSGPLTLTSDTGITFSVMPARVEMQDRGKYKYICFPVAYFVNLNSTYSPVDGLYDLPQLCNKLGIGLETRIKTTPLYWTLPAHKPSRLIKHLQDGVLSTSGGGACITFGLDGNLIYSDIKTVMDHLEPDGTYTGTTKSDQFSLEWINSTPGNLNVVHYTVDGFVEENFFFADGYGKGTVLNYVADEESFDYERRTRQNRFWKNYYTTRRKEIENALCSNIGIGTKLIGPDKKSYFVWEYSTSVVSNNQQTSLTLVSSKD